MAIRPRPYPVPTSVLDGKEMGPSISGSPGLNPSAFMLVSAERPPDPALSTSDPRAGEKGVVMLVGTWNLENLLLPGGANGPIRAGRRRIMDVALTGEFTE